MVEIAISVAAKIAEYLVAPVGRPFRYLWNYKTNLDNLKEPVKKLEHRRETVERSITVGEEPLPHVKYWQQRANRIIPEALELINEDNPEQANIQCCKGFSCPNLMNRYQLSKKAGKLKSDVVDLEQEAAKFKEVSYPTIPDDPWLQSGDGYEAFHSRSSVLKNIIDALRDPEINMVGIYGMGGIGKTTLARKVAKHIQQDNPSHVIVYVEVTKTPNIKNIQQAIGGKLGLKFHDETEYVQASKLYRQLKKEVTVSEGADNSGEKKKEKKILLILDNIWERIDLEQVGIPLGGNCKGLQLLLTTRSIHVLTNQMNSYCNFSVETLEEAEAWNLFKKTAGTCVDNPDLKNIAPEVAKKCGNMPLAIVTIASALKDKEESTWSTALNELKNPSLEGFEETMTVEVYTSIKFSYDHLDTKELKEVFLLCSRMGRTYDASIRDLFMYGLGLGFFKRSNTLEEAQCKVEDLVNKLKGNSLLLDAPNETRESLRHVIPNGERFAMHDVICDVARSIDRQKGNVCNVIDDAFSYRWAKTNILKNCTSITLRNISKVPKDLRLELPQLEFFYMKTKDSFSKIVDDFFVEMPSLLVLHLIEMNLSPLPTSLSNLINLQTLCLDACKLGDIADIGKLKKLEILSFRGSKIKKLSEEMRHLTSIRLLDLTDCSTLEIIPPNVISCFTQLEALYMYNTFIEWEVGGLDIGRKNASLNELKHLCDRLTTLEICIPNVKMSEGLLSPHLKRYKISINSDRILISPPKNSRTLGVKLDTNDNADEVISQLKGIKQLELVAESRDDFTDSKQSVSLDALFSLESLFLDNFNFEKICNVPLAAQSFCQLRTITVYSCHKLTHIFSFSFDRVLPKLQEIRVSSCKNMEGIFAIEREDDVNNSELIHEIQFSQLCYVSLTYLRQLKSFCHRVKTTSQLQLTSSTNDGEIISEDMINIPKSLFNEKVVFPNLETLVISHMSAEKIWHNQLPTMSSSFQNLNRLVVEGCNNLKVLFSSSMVNSFVQLQYLKISYCSMLEEMVFMEELKEEERKDTQFPFLKEMTITHRPNFKGFISNDKIGFPSLKAMEIHSCHKLKEFIFNDKVAVPNIENLTLWGMDNLEKIWHNQLINDSFCKLKSLEVEGCMKLLNVFPSNICGRLLSSLESLEVDSCDSLEEIFDSRMMLSFENLQKLKVSSCPSLKNLFSASILAKEESCSSVEEIGFPSLKEMEIESCPKLKEFIFNDKVVFPNLETLVISDISAEKIWHNQLPTMSSSFQNLNRLVVRRCNNLKEIFSSSMVNSFVQLQYLEISGCSLLEEVEFMEELKEERKDTQFPFLKEMTITFCPNFKGFISNDKIGFPSLKAMEINMCPKLKEFIFNDKVAVPNLEELRIFGMENLEKIWHDQLVKDSFCKLKSLQVYSCKKLLNGFPSNICGRLLSLESLEVTGCDSLEEIFDLRELSIYDSQIMFSFESLQKLRVIGCGSLKNLFSTSILAKEGVVMEEAPARFHFPKLLSLELSHLPDLRSFYPGRHKLEGSVLKTLKLFACGIHEIDEIGFPSLKEMEITRSSKLKEFIFNNKVAVPNIEKLKIWGTDNLEKIWHKQLVNDSFCKLKSLEVHYCAKLLKVFPSNICERLLSSLESLVVEGCDSLEEIFDLRELSIYDSQIMLSFESLQRLEVSGCRSLKNLFSASILAKEGVVREEAPARFLFPKLTSLRLSSLPELRSFYPGRYKVERPVLKTLQMVHCGIRDIDEEGQMQQPFSLSLVEQAFPCLEELSLDGEQAMIFSQGDLTTQKLQEVKIG